MFLKTAYTGSTALLILIFSYSGMIKFIDPNAFTSAMYHQPFNDVLTEILIYTLPPAELLTALLLVIPKTRFAGIVAATLQMLLFTAYTVMVLLNYYEKLPCACGGFIQNLSWQQHLLLNISLLCTCIIALVLHRLSHTHNANHEL